jgi:hypothetical protein
VRSAPRTAPDRCDRILNACIRVPVKLATIEHVGRIQHKVEPTEGGFVWKADLVGVNELSNRLCNVRRQNKIDSLLDGRSELMCAGQRPC